MLMCFHFVYTCLFSEFLVFTEATYMYVYVYKLILSCFYCLITLNITKATMNIRNLERTNMESFSFRQCSISCTIFSQICEC